MKINKIKVGDIHYDIQDNTSGYATTSYVEEYHDSTKADKSEISDMATKSWVQEYIQSLDGDEDYY